MVRHAGGGTARIEARGALRCPAWLVYIGNASCTLYLAHESISGLPLKLAARSGAQAALGGGAIYLITLAGTIALGCGAYALIERPLLQRLSRPSRNPAARRTSLAGR